MSETTGRLRQGLGVHGDGPCPPGAQARPAPHDPCTGRWGR